MFFFDPLFFVVMLPVLALSLYAQARVKSAFHKYSKVTTQRRYSGAEVAREILRSAGIQDVTVEQTQGFLSDHYHPLKKTLALSPDVYSGRSIASAGIAAHEVGHAIQHARGYVPLQLRALLVAPASIGSNLGVWIIMAAFLFGGAATVMGTQLAYAGLGLLGCATLFTLVTLPVELDASARAVRVLVDGGLVTRHESDDVKKVLNAAALTYLAAALASVTTLLYYAWRLGLLGGSSRD